jgi:hypothetical protein
MAEVINIASHLTEVGSTYRFDVEDIINGTLGRGLVSVLIIGQDDQGELVVRSAANAGESLVLMELAKARIIHGE